MPVAAALWLNSEGKTEAEMPAINPIRCHGEGNG
jgi:hypothetical protein